MQALHAWLCRALPAPLFDTQIAAALCGLGAAMGYQKLVETQLGVVLAKSETRSDWLRRPLSEACSSPTRPMTCCTSACAAHDSAGEVACAFGR